MADETTRVHGTCIDIGGFGVLFRGPSGSGKSDIALRLIDAGARLVADDQVDIRATDAGLAVSSPPEIRGRMEVRGIGICDMPAVDAAPLRLVVDLIDSERVERLPRPASCRYLGVSVPRVAISPFESSADAKVRLAVAMASGNIDAAS